MDIEIYKLSRKGIKRNLRVINLMDYKMLIATGHSFKFKRQIKVSGRVLEVRARSLFDDQNPDQPNNNKRKKKEPSEVPYEMPEELYNSWSFEKIWFLDNEILDPIISLAQELNMWDIELK